MALSTAMSARSDVLVLCYHAVSEDWPAALSATPAALEAQLRFLVERGYEGATFHEAVTDPPAAKTLAVTFDDAYRSVLTRGEPILRSLGLVGTVFVPTAHAGSDAPMAWPGIDGWLGGPHEEELLPLSWEELRRLADLGWEIGSHSRTHPRLPELDDAALTQELEDSRGECERRLEQPCRTVAYPYGAEDDRVVRATAEAGYEAAAALSSRLSHGDPLRFPRIGIYHSDSAREFALKVHPAVRRMRGSPLAHVAFAARQALRGRP